MAQNVACKESQPRGGSRGTSNNCVEEQTVIYQKSLVD